MKLVYQNGPDVYRYVGAGTDPETGRAVTVAYGKDAAVGWFVTITIDAPDDDTEDELILDQDTMFTGLTHRKMLEIVNQYVPDLVDES